MADPDLLRRLQLEDGVAADDGDPSVAAWFGDLVRGRWDDLVGSLSSPEAGVAAVVVLVLVGLLLVVLLVGVLRRAARRALRAPAPAAPTPAAAVPWRARVEALLAAGDVRGAARAAWLGMSGDLARQGLGRADPDLTHGEYVATVPRAWPRLPDLVALGREADRICYAPTLASVGEAARFFHAAARLAAA